MTGALFREFALTLAGAFLFGFPALAIVGGGVSVFGLPPLVLYLFGAWGLFIALTRVATRAGRQTEQPAAGQTRTGPGAR